MLRPSPFLNDEQREFVETVSRFARDQLDDPGVGERDAEGTFWSEGWKRCAALGLCGLPAPEAHGGSGTDRTTTAAALEALGFGCDDFGLVFSVNAHLFSAVIPLARFADDEQQERYLAPLCRGEAVGVHAMTEPDSGSDAFALRTVAEPDGDGWRLRGRKALITNAPVADLILVFARAPGTEGPLGISAFVVEAGAAGLAVETPTEKLGLRTSPMAEMTLDDVRVDPDALIGREGRGARVFAHSMEWERLLIMASQLGALARSLEEALDYTRSRRQFGAAIGSFQAVADRLVDTSVNLDAARALLYETAWRYDHGERRSAPAAAVKLLAAETALEGSLALLQVHGGYGFTRDLPFERRLRDAVGGRLYSGTSEMMRRVIARDLGL